MNKVSRILLFTALIVLGSNCREPFTPDFITGQNDFLVVEGFINVGQKAVTTIVLSRVSPLLSTEQVMELGATVSIENDDGAPYPLTELSNGRYQSDSLTLDPAFQYRIKISARGHSYTSAFTQPSIAPPIDSVYWQEEDGAIQLYVASHDPANTTWYYGWNYYEAWEINSDYRSRYSFSNGVFTGRSLEEMNSLFRCWQFATTGDLRFATTTQFDVDQINYPLLSFAKFTDRTSVKYSILVQQRAMKQEEFNFLQLIQKNSTVTGSLFDALPSEINGNLISTDNPDESVIGFVGCSTVTTKRVFFTALEFGNVLPYKCEKIEAYKDDFDFYFGNRGFYIPVEGFLRFDNPDSSKYTGALKTCMDCRLRGTPIKPDYWE